MKNIISPVADVVGTPGKGDLLLDPRDMSLRFYGDDRLGGFKTPGFNKVKLPAPGPTVIKKSAGDVGFYGEMVASALITPQELCERVGLNAGSLVNVGSSWLKFNFKGKTLYTTMKGIRTGLSWGQIYARGLVYGINGPGPYPVGGSVNQQVIVELNGSRFLVRCFKGADTDPVSFGENNGYNKPTGTLNSEWHLMMNALTDGTLGNYSLADLGITNTTHSWCQEANGGLRTLRGVNNTADLYMRSANDNSAYRGFRPILELID